MDTLRILMLYATSNIDKSMIYEPLFLTYKSVVLIIFSHNLNRLEK